MSIKQFLEQQTQFFSENYKKLTHVSWMLQTTGDPQWAKKLAEAESVVNEYFANQETFELVNKYLQANHLTDEERRQLYLLYLEFKPRQVSREKLDEISKLSAELNVLFNTYSPTIDGKKINANDVRDVLESSVDSNERERYWKASKEVGKAVEEKLIALVKKRNEIARLQGYGNYYDMAFELQELDQKEVFRIFDELLENTNDYFSKLKGELDDFLAKKFNIKRNELMPWHYADPFFQKAPTIMDVNLDEFFKGKDVVQLTADTFESMGLGINDLLAKSDLYPREGKNPTAFCIDMDREGDTRVLCNTKSDSYWMGTNLHEFGHAAYNKYIDENLPFLLRQNAHILTTEAIAMLFGKMMMEPIWLKKFLHVEESFISKIEADLKKQQQLEMLISARFIITFVKFERELYRNPDQDLNALWWKLVKEIQQLNVPVTRDAPDWAAKIHFTLAPVYYQNYLLGELTAAQLHHYINQTYTKEFFTKEVGDYLKNEFFKLGATISWNEKIKQSTKEYLNPKYFNQFYTMSN